MYTCVCIYIYIYIYVGRGRPPRWPPRLRRPKTRLRSPGACLTTPNLPTIIVDFRGFDSSIILILRGGILRPIGDFPESLSQAMLVGVMLVGRLGLPQISP